MTSGPGRLAADLAPEPKPKSGEVRDENVRRNVPLCFAVLYTRMMERARELGYALALHGTLRRDLDVVAIPWTAEAVPARELADAMIETSGGFLGHGETDEYFLAGCPDAKPHGRLCWCVHLGAGPYIDLSVVPRTEEPDKPWLVGDPPRRWVAA